LEEMVYKLPKLKSRDIMSMNLAHKRDNNRYKIIALE